MKKYDIKDLHPSGVFRKSGWKLGLLLLVTMGILVISIRNVVNLQLVLDESTIIYISEIASRMANTISDTIESKKTDMVNLADSIGRTEAFFDREETADFMGRKASLLGFDAIVLLHSQGNYIQSSGSDEILKADVQNIWDMETVQSAFDGEVGIAYVEDQDLYYSAPVWEGEEIGAVLVGVRSKENMQSIIASKCFDGKALNCLVDSKGNLLLDSEDMRPFEQLEEIFEVGSEEVKQNIVEMRKNIAMGENGVFEFTSIDNSENYLFYNALHVNDWVIMTIAPVNLITAGSDRYIVRFFALTGGIFVALAVFWFLLYWIYDSSRKKLIEIAFTDPLTGGMNGKAFQLRYEEAAENQNMKGYAIVLLDVRNFKLVNENFGITAGNQTLQYIYQVLQRHMRAGECEFAARSETDHFFLCIKESDGKEIRSRLRKIVEDINAFRGTDGPHYQLSFWKGACLVDNGDLDIITLQDRARVAARQGERAMDQECAFYDERITEKIKKEQELNELFEESFENHDFLVYLQPKVGLKDGRLTGAEALIRWKHPKKGMIFPPDFIPLFENNGKICRLDVYVFEETCKLLSRWKKEGKELVPVSVNLSRKHFYDPNFLEEFDMILKQYDIPYDMIEFELTESIFLDDAQLEAVKKGIEEMHRLGFCCSLDDFGSGFSSLGLLKEFDVDTLKMDRSFFLDISSEKARDVITCVVELAKKLHVKTVAEGIEMPEQLEYLRSIQCDEVQGYIFSPPLPVEEFEQWEEQHWQKA